MTLKETNQKTEKQKNHTKSYLTEKILQLTFDDDTWHYLDNKTDRFIFKRKD